MVTFTPADPVEVAEVLDTDLEPSELSSFCEDANLEVRERLEATDGLGVSRERASMLAVYLAAHLVRMTKERQEESVRLESVRVDYSGAFDKAGFQATGPGQNVLMLDSANLFTSDGAGPGRFVATASPYGDRDDRAELTERERDPERW